MPLNENPFKELGLKKIFLTGLALASLMMLSACGNKTVFDTNYTFNYAQVKLPDGSVKTGKVKEWTDYSDGDQLQIRFEDGTTYLVHSSQAVLSVDEIETTP
ncbi:hypothetical protein ACHBHL_07885 [Streptococcus sp. A27]|uniref:hypothetical protein n=1 Tax=unclassified Streptococcus TaxID=2608887 RepID=UPI00374CA2FA